MNHFATLSQVKIENDFIICKPWDEIQLITEPPNYKGYRKIITAGHGYLVVEKGSPKAHVAKKELDSSGYGFNGSLAYYLEED